MYRVVPAKVVPHNLDSQRRIQDLGNVTVLYLIRSNPCSMIPQQVSLSPDTRKFDMSEPIADAALHTAVSAKVK